MTFVSSSKDTENLTLTVVAEFAAGRERVWQVWEDARQLERWWGPPGYPATFVRHEFVPGGRSHYYMTGPDGERGYGWWEVTSVEAPDRLEFLDGFANEDGSPVDPEDTSTTVVTLDEAGSTTRMTLVATFRSLEQLQRMAEMGMEEGLREATGQIDAILAEPALK
ncbi:SRPBCC domain-containing protein [Sinomonas halotolerans]|uniref:SRPBCC domain-containing protein n=1 Tax=Sinomonas halotolerans TaxID=1644133 RepID=A0ABU9X207_9MICC